MTDELTPPDTPSPSSSVPEHLKIADRALKAHVWESAIRAYQSVLKQEAGNAAAHLGLARAYEGKSRDTGSGSFFLLALDHFRLAARLDPRSMEVHDALLAAAVKGNQLDDLLTEYKNLSAQDPRNDVHRAVLRKIETLLILKTRPATAAGGGPRPLIRFSLGVAAPLLGILGIVAFLAFRWQNELPLLSAFSPVFLRLGVLLLLVYFGYRLFAGR